MGLPSRQEFCVACLVQLWVSQPAGVDETAAETSKTLTQVHPIKNINKENAHGMLKKKAKQNTLSRLCVCVCSTRGQETLR